MSGLPRGWTTSTFKSLGELYCGQSPSSADVNTNGDGTPYVTGPEQWSGAKLQLSKWTTDPRRIVPDGCIFITVKGAGVGTLFPGIACAIGRDVYAFLPNKELHNRFIALALARNIQSVKRAARGDIPGLSKNDILDQAVEFPPLPEQTLIAKKVDHLAAISGQVRGHLGHVPRLVEKYKQAILKAAFQGRMTSEWRSKQSEQPAIEPRKAAKNRNLSSAQDFVAPYVLPKGWSWLCLAQIGEFDRGKSRHRPRNDPKLFGGRYPFIQTGDVRAADRFVTSCTKTLNDFGLSQSRLWPKGTVCITIAANIAETAILGIEAAFPDSVVGFLADDGRVSPSYVEFFMRTARDELAAFAPATAQKNINLEILSQVRLPVAPYEEQKEVVRLIETAFTWIDRVASENTSARNLIDHLDEAILAKAFRGELVPQDTNDKPAGVLLERIRPGRKVKSATKQPKTR
jgi:type I restriction enzyme, S subunit